MNSALGRRVAFTVGALLVYRLGTYIPLPGIDASTLALFFRGQHAALFGTIDLFAGGGVHRLAIFALGILPYLTAALLVQFVVLFSPRLRALERSGETGRQKIARVTLYVTLVLTLFQAFGVSRSLENATGLVTAPGWGFRIAATASLTGGTMLLVWLANQITRRGLGNGLALILLVGIVVEVPRIVAGVLGLAQIGQLSEKVLLICIAVAIALTLLIVAMEQARRCLPLEFADGSRLIAGRSELSLKLNGAGLVPTIVAAWLLALIAIGAMMIAGGASGWWSTFARELAPGHALGMVVYAVLIVFCAFVYTALILDPQRLAGDLERYGGALPGVEAGEPTATYLDHVLSRITVVGALYLVAVFVVPELLIGYFGVPFYFGGASLLIVVCAVIDLRRQIQEHALVRLGS